MREKAGKCVCQGEASVCRLAPAKLSSSYYMGSLALNDSMAGMWPAEMSVGDGGRLSAQYTVHDASTPFIGGTGVYLMLFFAQLRSVK